ncbi:MAG: flagellar hook-basal body complex protein FliE [Deltaproteobacteria bacterium]|nr:flagellar hook-basal body complex protein FliE [Deltaproteobacteria bacterium]
MSIGPVNPIEMFRPDQALTRLEREESAPTSFASFLSQSIGQVNELVNEADQKSGDLAVGKTENLHDAMITFEKAESAFKLLVQVRNKAVEAYHEIMRMQV